MNISPDCCNLVNGDRGGDDIKRKNFLLNLFFHKGVAVMRLASRFGRYNSIRRERPLTDDELMQFVPSVFSG
ncbi:DUF945 domain-containing protein, partial [Escherichia coli]|nr:DUF945 domain-containing protein [Escherichia coli]